LDPTIKISEKKIPANNNICGQIIRIHNSETDFLCTGYMKEKGRNKTAVDMPPNHASLSAKFGEIIPKIPKAFEKT
jgi:hypothetical protein